MSQQLTGKTFRRQCEVEGKEGTYFIVRKGRNNSRVVVDSDVNGEGELVKTADIRNERDVPQPEAEEAPGDPVTETPAASTEAAPAAEAAAEPAADAPAADAPAEPAAAAPATA